MTTIPAPSYGLTSNVLQARSERQTRVALGMLMLASASVAGYGAFRHNPVLSFAAIGLAVVGSVCFAAFGPGASMCALAFLVLAPGILGESSTRNTVLAVAILVACGISQIRREEPGNLIMAWALLPIAVGFLHFSSTSASAMDPNVVLVFAFCYMALGVFGGGLTKNRTLVRGAFWLVGVCLTVTTISYFVSWAMGFPQTFRWTLVSGRELDFSVPLTFTGGVGGFLPAIPRFLGWSGEAGLLAEYLLPIIVVLGVASSRRTRIWLAALTLAVTVIGQSTGTVLALVVGVFVFLVSAMFSKGHFTSSILFLLVGAVSFAFTTQHLLELKEEANAGSISDRGLSTNVTNGAGDINLISTFGTDRFLAACVTLSLVVLLWYGRRHPLSLAGAAAFAVVAVFNQPTQWHVGGLVMISTAIGYAYSMSTATETPRNHEDPVGADQQDGERLVTI